MYKVIIYPTDEGGVVVVWPTFETKLSLEEIAAKDVPAGKPFKFIDPSEVPTDRTFREAWEYEE